MRQYFFRRSLLAVACSLCAAPVLADDTSEIIITGNPLGREIAPVRVDSLSSAELRERGQASLGQTLDGLPGVSSTYFGTQSSRPVIRGLDGERVRVLSNSAATQDVSALSYDHAVPTDVLSADRIEVLRGPASLLYGGSAMGGVVNVLDNRIPREVVTSPQGRVQLQGASGNSEHAASAMLETGNGQQAWHVDGFERRSGDVRVPTVLGRIPNSDAGTRGAALGFGHFASGARLGVSASTWRSDYGSVVEDKARIGMRSDRLAFEGLWREPAAGWRSLKLQAGVSDYEHTEFDAGLAGVVFARRGQDVRVEARHAPVDVPMGPIEGVLGLQWEASRFKADGEEAFVPYSRTRSQAVFALEEWRRSWGLVQVGARLEQVSVTSEGSPSSPDIESGQRRFAPNSVSLGGQYLLGAGWMFTGQVAHSERAPSEAELFANGAHLATQTWERGDSGLGLERSNNLELGAERREGPHPMKFSVFESRFSNFISLASTGDVRGGDALPEYAFTGVRARLRGWEASGQSRLWQAAGALDLNWRADRVLADNQNTGQPLPRIAPWRVGLGASYSLDAWRWRLGVDHAGAQRRVPEGSASTAAYTFWNASVNYRQKLAQGTVNWFARIDNLGNVQAYSASAILTSTVPGRVPLPGRSLRLGAQWQF